MTGAKESENVYEKQVDRLPGDQNPAITDLWSPNSLLTINKHKENSMLNWIRKQLNKTYRQDLMTRLAFLNAGLTMDLKPSLRRQTLGEIIALKQVVSELNE